MKYGYTLQRGQTLKIYYAKWKKPDARGQKLYNSIEMKSTLAVAGGLEAGDGEWGVTTNGFKVYCWGDEIVLQLMVNFCCMWICIAIKLFIKERQKAVLEPITNNGIQVPSKDTVVQKYYKYRAQQIKYHCCQVKTLGPRCPPSKPPGTHWPPSWEGDPQGRGFPTELGYTSCLLPPLSPACRTRSGEHQEWTWGISLTTLHPALMYPCLTWTY